MNARLFIVLLLLLIAIIVASSWRIFRPHEPEHDGKPLSSWLQDHTGTNPAINGPEWKKADEALRRIGTNGIPTLVRMIGAHDSVLKLKLLELGQQTHLFHIRYRPSSVRNSEGAYAFKTFGAEGKDAVPALIKIYEKHLSWTSQEAAAEALGYIGHAAKAAIPALLKNVTNTDLQVRRDAVLAIYSINAEPEMVIPAMIQALHDPDLAVRWNAAITLGNFGSRATSAIPALDEALKDATIKEQVEIALRRIKPQPGKGE